LRKLPPAARLRETLAAGESAVLFLKGPPTMLDRASPTHRGRTEGDALLHALIEAERVRAQGAIAMVPQTFVWTQRPERLGFSIVDPLFGPSEFPGELRATAQVLLNYKNCVVRAGEPLALREFIAQQRGADDDAIVRRLTYALLRKVERER